MDAASAAWRRQAAPKLSSSAHIHPRTYAGSRCCLQVLVAERGTLVFVFNFSPTNDYEGLKASPSNLSSIPARRPFTAIANGQNLGRCSWCAHRSLCVC